jgi:hypothetical protein
VPGFTLAEMLVATLIAMVTSGAVLLVVQPLQGMFQAQLEVTDLQQRLRAAVDAMSRDLVMAGAGSTAGATPGPLAQVEAPVLPYRHGAVGDDPRANIFYRADTITLRYVQSTASQPAIASHTYYLRPDAATGAFQLMHYDGGGGDFPLVDHVVLLAFAYAGDPRPPTWMPPPDAMVDPDATDEYPAGENCLFRRVDGEAVPRLATLSATAALVPLDPSVLIDGPWCPAAASAARFDADLLRIRRVGVRLRLQVGQAALRGAAGRLFSRGGTATSAFQLAPDDEIRFDVSPRNLNVDR